MSTFTSRTSGFRERMINKVIKNAKNNRELISIENAKHNAYARVPQGYYI